jgi:hypothetical protein
LECAIENTEYAVSIDDVEARLDHAPEPSWTTTDDQGDELFDLDRLDTLDITAYFAELDGASTDDEGDKEDEREEGEDNE